MLEILLHGFCRGGQIRGGGITLFVFRHYDSFTQLTQVALSVALSVVVSTPNDFQ
jgi:hypothetical protein